MLLREFATCLQSWLYFKTSNSYPGDYFKEQVDKIISKWEKYEQIFHGKIKSKNKTNRQQYLKIYEILDKNYLKIELCSWIYQLFLCNKKCTWSVFSIFKTTILCHHRIPELKRLKNSGYPLPGFKRGAIKPFHLGENGFSSKYSLFLSRIENDHVLWIHIKSCVKSTSSLLHEGCQIQRILCSFLYQVFRRHFVFY